MVVVVAGEVGVEVGVQRDDLGDVAVELLDEGHVLGHVVRQPGLVVLVHLLDESSVPIQHRLDLVEVGVEAPPDLDAADIADVLVVAFSDGGALGQGRAAAVVAVVVAAVVGGVVHA